MCNNNKISNALIILLFIFWCFNIIMSIFAGVTEDIIFKHKTGDVLQNYTTQVTPQDYTFKIWYLIFGWILAGYIFLIICIFKPIKDASGEKLKVFTTSVAGLLIVNCALYTSWLFVLDNQYMIAAAVVLFAIMGTNWVALGLFSFNLYENTQKLQERSPMVLNCYRILVQNSLGLYATWTTIAALLNLTSALLYDADVADPTPSFINLGILSGLLAVCIPLDVFMLDKYTRYMITPLFTILWALVGIFIRLEKVEYNDDAPKHFTVGLIGVLGVLVIGRLVLTVFRAIRFPFK